MQAVRTIQVRPSRNPRWQEQDGWEVYEGDGVSPTFCGPSSRNDALSYACQRAGYAPTQIEVLDDDWNAVETISPETVRGLI